MLTRLQITASFCQFPIQSPGLGGPCAEKDPRGKRIGAFLNSLLTLVSYCSVCDLQEKFRSAIYEFDKVQVLLPWTPS